MKLKRQPPGGGLAKLALELPRRPALHPYRRPQPSPLYTYLRRFYPGWREHRPAATRRPPSTPARADSLHPHGQIDFKGAVDFPHLGKVNPLNSGDEFSCAPLAGIMHSGQRGAGTMRHVQQDLRHLFSQGGLPDAIGRDRDPTCIGSSRLVGLGVEPLVNRAHRPTDNAQVERCNGLWVDPVARGASPAW